MIKNNPHSQSKQASREKLLNLLASSAYRHGDFVLSSGKKSHHYVNCKPVSLSGIGLSLISNAFLEHVSQDTAAVAGMTLGADPLVSGVAITASLFGRTLDALILRKEAKGHGTSAWLEGPLPPKGALITVLEDVVTTGGSSLKAVRKLREAGYRVETIVTIVDRQEGGLQLINQEGLNLISLFLLEEVSQRAYELGS